MTGRTAIITGISGGLARSVARRLHEQGWEIVGIDYRDPGRLDVPASLYRAPYHKTKCEDVFRRHPPNLVLHLGRVGDLKQGIQKRFNLNVVGSRRILELAHRYEAERLVVLSTFHIYGAHPHNHIPIHEDEPLRAGTDFPQIADAIQLDNQAVIWAYQHPELKTAILRPTNVVGPVVTNAMSTFLRGRRKPYLAGFDPMTQFIHADDLAEAIVRMAASNAVGVFNVPGPYAIPWRSALRTAGGQRVAVPDALAFSYLRVAGLFTQTFPPYLMNFFKYPCVISGQKLEATLGWRPSIAPEDAVRDAARGPAR